AQALVRQYTNMIGLFVTEQSSYSLGRVLSTINAMLHESNKRLLLEVNDDLQPKKEKVLLDRLLQYECDTFIIIPYHLSNQDVLSCIQSKLVIVLGRQIDTLSKHSIYVDELDLGYRATYYLTELHHQKIGFIGSSIIPDISQLRKIGYMSAMKQRCLLESSNWIQYDMPSFQGGYAAANILLEKDPHITAMIVHNDIMAAGVMDALKNRGKKIPQDIALIACEDTGVAKYLTPALTALRYPIEDMIESAVCLALTEVKRKGYTQLKHPKTLSFIARLLIRDSVSSCLSMQQ
ncbi:MAG: LacI family transcriptional regulator, partial [Endozoicomonadaceae bacterium]|nr:LacI family transcriptional regulator [Endozoicomonadaceae bacterium]